MTHSSAQQLQTAADAALGDVGAMLPAVVPLTTLPEPWSHHLKLSRLLPEHFPAGSGGVRRWLDWELRDDPGPTDGLSHDEASALLPALCALGHTYRWDSVPPEPARFTERHLTLPRGLERPWAELSRRFDLPRVGSAWTLHLSNWRLTTRAPGDPYTASELTIDGLHVAHQWLASPADQDFERFSLTFVLLEARAGPGIAAACAAVHAAEEGDPHRVAEQLARLSAAIGDASREFVIAIRDGFVEPRRWLELVQPTMAWALPDKDGLIMPGPNGLQLPSLQLWDALLGVPRDSDLGQQAMLARASMPREHRRLLAAADRCAPELRSFVVNRGTSVTRRRYHDVLNSLRRLRTAHRVRAARYLRAGRVGVSARVSTGLNLAWRPEDDALDPVAAFEQLADDRVQDVVAAHLDRPLARLEAVSGPLILPRDDVERMLACGVTQGVAHDDVILRTGEVNDALWYIVDGLVRIETRPLGDRPVSVDHLGPGEFFGEVSFLTALPVSAWVRAEGDVVLVRTDRAVIERLLTSDADLASRLYKALAVSLARRLRETTSLLTEAEAVRARPQPTRTAGE